MGRSTEFGAIGTERADALDRRIEAAMLEAFETPGTTRYDCIFMASRMIAMGAIFLRMQFDPGDAERLCEDSVELGLRQAENQMH